MLKKLETLKWTALRRWGILFRALFISSVGIIAYFCFGSQDIGDIPFSELTLKMVFSHLFFVLLAFGCLAWFFNFPDPKDIKNPSEHPYVSWGWFGVFIALIVSVVLFFIILLT